MTTELETVEKWAATLLTRLSPGERRKLMRDIAVELRRSQQARIAAQRNPDGSAYEPRKARPDRIKLRGKRGRVKSKAMFVKLRTGRMMHVEVDTNALAVGFAGRAARVATVHQDGMVSSVAPHGPAYSYPRREVLGVTDREHWTLRDRLLFGLFSTVRT